MALLAASFLTSCEQEVIEFTTVEDNISSVEDIDIHKESFVDFWLNINERVKDNGILIDTHLSEQNDEKLKEAFLKDIGYTDMGKTYADFVSTYNYSLDKYRKSLEANGVNINDEDILRKTFSNDINKNIIVNRSCEGHCNAEYYQDALFLCAPLNLLPWPGGSLAFLACVAVTAYELDQCLDNCP